MCDVCFVFFFQAEDGIRDLTVTGVQTCALPISLRIFLAVCIAVRSTSGAVWSPRTTSKSFMTLAGEKKCSPTTSPGREMLRSEEHTSELQSQSNLVCRLLLEKKKNTATTRALTY